ncbi:MAG: FAD-dependent oxidoreductase [Verrucomicrobia bacterium]|nr:FAD-dependent oxidoreductase [Verrucomicrobiota bacterium]
MTMHSEHSPPVETPSAGADPEVRAGHFDLVVLGATPGGIACAVRAAREGLAVLLVEPSNHVGGMWTSGLQGFDTRYAGHRCPFLSEFLGRLQEHYRREFGAGSPEYAMACFGDPDRHGERPRFEARIAELVFREMLGEQSGIRLMSGYRLSRVERHDRLIRRLLLETDSSPRRAAWASGEFFVDATYEADLAAGAGVPYRMGREDRAEYGEPHAGRHLTSIEPIGESGRAAAQRLNLHFFNRTSRRVFPGSTGEGDAAVQAYTLRLTLTDLPANRRSISRPAGYDRQRFVGMLDRSPDAHDKAYPLSSHYLHGEISNLRLAVTLPNRKTDWLYANFVGRNHAYPEADPATRRRIYEEHVAHALGTLYFLQHDPAVPATVREEFARWGLARDEYVDTANVPRMMYVREARRPRGLHVFSEHDATRHPRHGRTPLHPDSVAFAEWPMDSHDCNPIRQPGSCNDGEFILADTTLPSQVPFRTMVAATVDNLLMPVCLSATHVGWGTLRLEPVFVHTGEAAGVAVALCLRDRVRPRALCPAALQEELLRRRIAVAYFADVDLGGDDAWTRDVQFLGARGFFSGYDADPARIVTPALAAVWRDILVRTLAGDADPNDAASRVAAVLEPGTGAMLPDVGGAGDQGAAQLRRWGWDGVSPVTIREACHALRGALRAAEVAGLSV